MQRELESTKWHQSCQAVAQTDTTLLYPNHLPNEFKIYEISNLIYGFLNRKFWTLPILMYHHDWCLFLKNYIHSLSLTESDIFSRLSSFFCSKEFKEIPFGSVSQKQQNLRFIFWYFFREGSWKENESEFNKSLRLPRTLSQATLRVYFSFKILFYCSNNFVSI